MTIWQEMLAELERLEAAGLRRSPVTLDSPVGPRVKIDGRESVCLCSNDYLALGNDPAVRAAATCAIERWGVGSGASRLVSGTQRPHVVLEADLANFKKTDAALVTSTGWQANAVAMSALAGKGDLILCDKLNHASILDAAVASGARMRTYAHRDVSRLQRLLDAHRSRYDRCLIVTDSLFSMDGDLASLENLCDIKDRYDAQLLIDEAHATGVLGDNGRGAAELLGVEHRVDAVVGTLSKGVGAMGGFVAGPGVLIETIRNRGRAFIYTTALPPAICAAACCSLRIIRNEPERRRTLLKLAAWLRSELAAAGFDTLDSDSQIIPIVLGDADRAVDVSRRLLAEGFLVPAIRPPTVPPNTSRLRVSLSAGHHRDELGGFVAALLQAAGADPRKV